MSLTSSGALKAQIEALGLSLSAYRDRAPDKATLPYVTISEAIAVTFDGMETQDVGAQTRTGVETVQVDLWQQWRDPATRGVTESPALTASLTRALHGMQLPTAPSCVYAVLVQSARRLVELDNNLVHMAYTCTVNRVL